MGIITLELYLGIHPFDPQYVGNHFSIVENIMQNLYVVETTKVKRDKAIADFASKILQTQPYQRFRNYRMLKAYIDQNI